MKIKLDTNEVYNVDLQKIVNCHPIHKEQLAGIVLKAKSFDNKLKQLLDIKLVGSKGKVIKFLIACMIRHKNLMWGMMNSFCYCESFLDGFIYLKHNLEYVAVISKISNEIKNEMKDEDWKTIECENLYNVKSIVQYCKDSGKNDQAKKFEEIGTQKSIIAYIKKMPDIFQQQYAIANALSHPNNYTTLNNDFPFITGEPIEYLINQTNYLQGLLEKSVDKILRDLK